jgi:hypothetical protein
MFFIGRILLATRYKTLLGTTLKSLLAVAMKNVEEDKCCEAPIAITDERSSLLRKLQESAGMARRVHELGVISIHACGCPPTVRAPRGLLP